MLGLALTCRHELVLTHQQKLLVTSMLALRLELREPSCPTPARGLAGILAADTLLKQRNGVGILVGGLAETVWSQRRTEDQLAKHKDVDVLVTKADEPFDRFEGGIDWWQPEDVHFDSIKTRSGEMSNVTRRFWINGNHCALTYRVDMRRLELEPGLYILPPSETVQIRIAESEASIDGVSVALEDDTEEYFFTRLRKKLGVMSRLPSFLKSSFGRIPSPWVTDRRLPAPYINSVPLEDQVALNGGQMYRTGRKRT